MMVSPISSNQRIRSLDLLRGFAVLGILFMNIQSYSMPGSAYLNPMSFGDMEGLNKAVYIFSYLFADQKFISIFSMLFGAGIILMSENVMAKGGSAGAIHYRRSFWLLVIGMVHAHLIWYGDILVAYALCGALVFLFRKGKPKSLIIWGLIIMAVHTGIYLMFGLSIQYWPAEAQEQIRMVWEPSEELLKKEIMAFSGDLGSQLAENSAGATMLQTWVFLMGTMWRVIGLMMVGMGLYKLGILSAEKDPGFYKKGLVWGLILGTAISLVGLWKNAEAGYSWDFSFYLGSQFIYWGSLFTAYGYICAVMLIARSSGFASLKGRLEAVGRMAFTNYLSQSVICVLIFFGAGLGLFGQVSRTYQLLIVLAILAVQILWSKPILERYRFGPMEWLWRSLTYWKAQPMKKI